MSSFSSMRLTTVARKVRSKTRRKFEVVVAGACRELLICCPRLLGLIEEELVRLAELEPEPLVHHVDDSGQVTLVGLGDLEVGQLNLAPEVEPLSRLTRRQWHDLQRLTSRCTPRHERMEHLLTEPVLVGRGVRAFRIADSATIEPGRNRRQSAAIAGSAGAAGKPPPSRTRRQIDAKGLNLRCRCRCRFR